MSTASLTVPAAPAAPILDRVAMAALVAFVASVQLSIALASMMRNGNVARAAEAFAPSNPLAPRIGHFAPKAKRVIYLFQAGAPSHLDLYDFKPELAKRNGQLPPADQDAVWRSTAQRFYGIA